MSQAQRSRRSALAEEEEQDVQAEDESDDDEDDDGNDEANSFARRRATIVLEIFSIYTDSQLTPQEFSELREGGDQSDNELITEKEYGPIVG